MYKNTDAHKYIDTNQHYQQRTHSHLHNETHTQSTKHNVLKFIGNDIQYHARFDLFMEILLKAAM